MRVNKQIGRGRMRRYTIMRKNDEKEKEEEKDETKERRHKSKKNKG